MCQFYTKSRLRGARVSRGNKNILYARVCKSTLRINIAGINTSASFHLRFRWHLFRFLSRYDCYGAEGGRIDKTNLLCSSALFVRACARISRAVTRPSAEKLMTQKHFLPPRLPIRSEAPRRFVCIFGEKSTSSTRDIKIIRVREGERGRKGGENSGRKAPRAYIRLIFRRNARASLQSRAKKGSFFR